MTEQMRPTTLTIAALGGQGGGVVQEWMVSVAQATNHQVQATSVPGVAQRTGATIYYLEFFPASDTQTPVPVMALMPVAGNCDLIIAAELAEAARMVQRRLVDAGTTIVTSTHRAYTIEEKSHLADGRADADELLQAVRGAAGRTIAFDMQQLATAHGAPISAAMLGAIAGAGVLPFPATAYEQAIRSSGRAVAENLAAFQAALAATTSAAMASSETPPVQDHADTDPRLADLPPPVAAVVAHALPRLDDYQSPDYSDSYLHHLQDFLSYPQNDYALAREVARGLALWMTFEDTIRIAQLKTRPERLHQLTSDPSGQQTIRHVTEYMKPRIEEIAGTAPVRLGRWIENSPFAAFMLQPFTRGLRIRSSSVFGYLSLRALAALRRYRRGTLRFARESEQIQQWLGLIRDTAREDAALAVEVAACQELIKGYGDTHASGLRNYQRIASHAHTLRGRDEGPRVMRELREAALRSEGGADLDEALRTSGLEATP